MHKDIEGPIINHGMNAVATQNHLCVDSVSKTDRTIRVYREKKFVLNENNYPFAFETFNIRNRNTFDNKVMLEFIKHHFEIAINQQTLTIDQIQTHKNAIEIIENEILQREDLEKVTFKFLLISMIKEKEFELELLKTKLTELEEK